MKTSERLLLNAWHKESAFCLIPSMFSWISFCTACTTENYSVLENCWMKPTDFFNASFCFYSIYN
jgi:hypothetical protein